MFRRVLLLVSTLTFALLGAANAVASDFDDGNFDIKVSSDIGEFLAAESGFSPPLARWSDGSAPLGDFRVWMRPLIANPPAVGIPAVSVGYDDGSTLMAAPGVSVNLLYKPFTLLKDAIDTAPTLLSDEEKDSLKKLVSDAASLATRRNQDLSQASELIVLFRNEMSERVFEGKISFDLAQSLFDSGFSLQYRLDTAP